MNDLTKSLNTIMLRPLGAVIILLACIVGTDAVAKEYSLTEAIQNAQANDPWLSGSRFRQANLEALSASAGTLPDPTVSVGMANVPIDSFDFTQEGMTQFKVGVSQMFPRGKTLSLRQEKLEMLSRAQPFVRENRKASTAVVVAGHWLEVFRRQKTIALIKQERGLFEHLVDVAQSSYTTASGRTRQQDFVRAQLELTRLEDRLTTLQQQREMQLAMLGEWLVSDGSMNDRYDLAIKMPEKVELGTPMSDLVGAPDSSSKRERLAEVLSEHPKIKSIDQKVSAGESGVTLAKQSYKPQWGVNASYGMRDTDPMGNDRSNFLSVGVSFDVPLFTGKRQDKQVQAATAEKEAVKTERALALRQLRSGFAAAEVNYIRLNDRKTLFDTRLLKEMSEQAEASLTAYTNDNGDFSEVVRARISELNAKIDALNIEVDIQKAIAQLNYFLVAKYEKTTFEAAALPKVASVSVGDENE
ncbi:TolC family protein [Teredinibacter haidensis]|uniref:TolC family protein n=1 Tax=Teredinibacter haidensis TaxID=2731755 RepID=UPI000A8B0DEB|nr:TolC family protein [Teredinibacter haidensis]